MSLASHCGRRRCDGCPLGTRSESDPREDSRFDLPLFLCDGDSIPDGIDPVGADKQRPPLAALKKGRGRSKAGKPGTRAAYKGKNGTILMSGSVSGT